MAPQAPTVVPQEMLPVQQGQQPVNNYYPDTPNDLTGGLPINLDSLRDGPPGTKPFYPYSTLIRCVSRLPMPLVRRNLIVSSDMQSRARQIRNYYWKISTTPSNHE